MNAKCLFERVWPAICIILAQAGFLVMFSGRTRSSCDSQAVAGGASYCEKP